MKIEKLPLPHPPKTQKKKNQGTFECIAEPCQGTPCRAAETPSEQIAISAFICLKVFISAMDSSICAKKKKKVVILGNAIQCRNHATFCASVVSVCPDVLLPLVLFII
jgi:hypothetical protein